MLITFRGLDMWGWCTISSNKSYFLRSLTNCFVFRKTNTWYKEGAHIFEPGRWLYFVKGIVFFILNVFPPMSAMRASFVYHFLFCFSLLQDQWRGIPTRLNNIPHSREIRKYFYDDVLQATQRAITNGITRLKVWHYYQNYM